MKITAFALAIVISVLYTAYSSAHQAPNSVKTMGEFAANVPIQMTEPLVIYCSEQTPESKAELEKEFTVFKAKFSEAIKPIMEKLASNAEFSAPVTEADQKQFSQIGVSMISEVKKLDPHIYCPAMLARLRATTVEALRISVETTLSKYESASKAAEAK